MHERDCNPENPVWKAYLAQISRGSILDRTYKVYMQNNPGGLRGRAETERHTERVRIGCFEAEIKKEGVVKLHFYNKDNSGDGPLSKNRMAVRREEISQIFRVLKSKHPELMTVLASSWLLGIPAVARLLPASFMGNVKPLDPPGFQSAGIWGQFLDSEGRVKNDLANQLVSKLPEVDGNHLADAFPLKAMEASAPIEDFYKEYGIE